MRSTERCLGLPIFTASVTFSRYIYGNVPVCPSVCLSHGCGGCILS